MIVAIDYDGTIGDANRAKTRWIETHLGKAVPPWDCNYTDCVPIIGVDACKQMGRDVFERAGTLHADEVPGALDAIKKLSQMAELYVVTARPERLMAFAQEWLEGKGVLSCFKALRSSSGTSKEAICTEIGADILIDDDARHLNEVKVEGLTRILLQDGRENEPNCSPDVHFCRNWADVLALIDRLPPFGP